MSENKFNCSKVIPHKCQANCCSDTVPLPAEFWEKYHNLALRTPLNIDYDDYSVGKTVRVKTIDKKCVFLNDSYGCSLYNDRPKICKLYGKANISIMLTCSFIDENGDERPDYKDYPKVAEITMAEAMASALSLKNALENDHE